MDAVSACVISACRKFRERRQQGLRRAIARRVQKHGNVKIRMRVRVAAGATAEHRNPLRKARQFVKAGTKTPQDVLFTRGQERVPVEMNMGEHWLRCAHRPNANPPRVQTRAVSAGAFRGRDRASGSGTTSKFRNLVHGFIVTPSQ